MYCEKHILPAIHFTEHHSARRIPSSKGLSQESPPEGQVRQHINPNDYMIASESLQSFQDMLNESVRAHTEARLKSWLQHQQPEYPKPIVTQR